MWIRLITSLGAYEIILYSIRQLQLVPSDVIYSILQDFPILGIVLAVMYYMRKTYREDADAQRKSMREVYDSNQVFLSELIKQLEAKQDLMTEKIEALSNQVAINTSTVNEIAKVDSIVNELITRLEEK